MAEFQEINAYESLTITNSPTWWKQISRIFKPSEIDILRQFSSFQKSDHAILQKISWEAKMYMTALINITYYECCCCRRVYVVTL
jgi:hypothetical protein